MTATQRKGKMNSKAQAFIRMKVYIQKEHTKIRHKLNSNKWEFKKLTEEQTILKRELAELHEMINYCEKRKDLEVS